MYRGTTPDLILTVQGIDLVNCAKLCITLEQGEVEITKTVPDDNITIADTHTVEVIFTQAETLRLHNGPAYVQIRGITEAGRAFATPINTIPVDAILLDGEI